MAEGKSTTDNVAQQKVRDIMEEFNDVDRQFAALINVINSESQDWQGQQANKFRNELVPEMQNWWQQFRAKAQTDLDAAAKIQQNIQSASDGV